MPETVQSPGEAATSELAESGASETHGPPARPPASSDAAQATRLASERAAEIRKAPHLHHPQLVVSKHVGTGSIFDKIANGVNRFCGSMLVFLGISISIVAWLFLGNVVGFDKTPWPLLLTILNLPQLSIMISLQVSANRSQAASDARAVADHETLVSLHELAKRELELLEGQRQILDILHEFASHDLAGGQAMILDTTRKLLALAGTAPNPAGG